MIGSRVVDGLPALTLASAAAGGIEATFVPGAGMVGCSLRHRGDELLGQRRGLRAYVADRATMGIPLLYPWANRVGRRHFEVAGREVTIDPEVTPVRLDADGLPMHGLLSAATGWQVERHEALADGAVLGARFDFAAHEALVAAFPFAHELRFEAALAGPRLTITTTVRASGDGPVPIAFGYHPYLRLPGMAREDWHVEVPVREQLRLDAQMLPTGERVGAEVFAGPAGRADVRRCLCRARRRRALRPRGERPADRARLPRRLSLCAGLRSGRDDVIAFEPMTAPTNALVDGGAELPLLAPGESYEAGFSITLADGA